MEAKLTLENINTAVEEVEAFYDGVAVDSTSAKKVALGVEETLLRFRDEFGEKQDFTLKTGKNFDKIKVVIEVTERMYDPFAKRDDAEQESVMMRNALSTMGVLPVWRYTRGTNVISYVINKKSIPEWTNLVIAIVLAIIAGLILRQAPENVSSFINDDIFSPLLDTFMNLLSGIASPMIFFAIVWGIYSIGDASTFNVLGKKMAFRDLSYTTAFTVVCGLLCMFFYNFEKGGTVGTSGYSDLFQMIINIVPSNIFTPFAEGNTLQILFLGIVIGIAMIMIGEKTQTVALIAEQLNYLVQIIMNFISKLVPFFVFGSLLDLILNNQIGQLKTSYKLLLCNVGSCILILLVYEIIVTTLLRSKASVFPRKALPTFLIGVTTASSAAAFSENMNTCIEKYGVKRNLANFGVPFNQVIYKPTVSILYFTIAIYTAENFGVPTSLSWFVTAFVMSIILGLATPPIPGGAYASIMVLFAQLQLPTDGLAVILAMNVVLDFLETPVDLVGGQAMLLLASNKFKLIDKEVFRK